MCSNIEMIEVSSSDVQSIGYDIGNKDLYVRFIYNNTLYVYNDVPFAVYEQIMNADSIGRALNTFVKGIYTYSKIG